MAAVDLTSVEYVRRHLQKQAGDVNQDSKIQELITAWSVGLQGYLRREFRPASSAVARDFEYDCSGLLDLVPYDLRSVTSVEELDYTGTSVVRTLTANDYRKWPVPAPEGVWTHLRIRAMTSVTYGWPSLVRVTGDWGFATVPQDIADVCASAVALEMRGEIQAFGSTFQPNSLGEEVNVAKILPPGLRARVARYKR